MEKKTTSIFEELTQRMEYERMHREEYLQELRKVIPALLDLIDLEKRESLPERRGEIEQKYKRFVVLGDGVWLEGEFERLWLEGEYDLEEMSCNVQSVKKRIERRKNSDVTKTP